MEGSIIMQDNLALIIIFAHICSAVALFNGVFTTFGQARVASAALESIARQPEAANDIRGSMIIGLAMAETSGIYGLLISIIMLFANPLVTIYVQNAVR
jgi:F-type H+-transporting ATPase subunit c